MSNFDTTQRPARGTTLVVTVLATTVGLVAAHQSGTIEASVEAGPEYRVLATNQTSTMQRELNQAADEGYRLEAMMGGETAFGGKEEAMMGGETAFGGKEVVAIVRRQQTPGRYAYRLLATLKTSTMQEEIQTAATTGFQYRAQTVFETAFGGEEVVVILERDKDATLQLTEYLLLATSRTSTLESELQAAARMGYELVGMAVGETALGGEELVAITRRLRP